MKTKSFNKDERMHIEKGKVHLENKEYKKAEKELKKALAINPKSKEVHFELGKSYYLQNQYQSAIEELEKTREIDPQNIYTYLFLAKIYKGAKKFDLALEELKNLLPNQLLSSEVKKELSDIYPEYINHIKLYNFEGEYGKAWEKGKKIDGIIPKGDIFSRNKLLNELEIAQKKLILASKPRNLIVTLTTRCNLDCVMCEEREFNWKIPDRSLKEIISLFPYLERIVWQGGEVFLLDYFGDLIEEAGKFPNIRQVITTNGLLLDEKWAEKLVKYNVDLTFSIDGVTREVYEKIRRGGKFGTLMKNLDNFNELRKRYNSSINTNLHVVIMRSNYHQIESFVDFAKEYGFKLLALLPIGGNFRSAENIFYNGQKEITAYLEKVIPLIQKKAEKYNLLLENRLPVDIKEQEPVTSQPEPSNSKMLCHLPWLQFYLEYDGSIRPDCSCKPHNIIGRLSENSLEEVWNNSKMQSYRKKIIQNHYCEICNPECITGKVSERYLKFF